MATQTINRETMPSLLREVSAGREGRVYRKPTGGFCVNWTDDANNGKRVPSCIIGHVAAKLGVIEQVDHTDRAVGSASLLSDIERLGEFEFTDGAKFAARIAQAKQDTGYTWGEAVDEAESASDGFE
jgi:hypothetical protein